MTPPNFPKEFPPVRIKLIYSFKHYVSCEYEPNQQLAEKQIAVFTSVLRYQVDVFTQSLRQDISSMPCKIDNLDLQGWFGFFYRYQYDPHDQGVLTFLFSNEEDAALVKLLFGNI